MAVAAITAIQRACSTRCVTLIYPPALPPDVRRGYAAPFNFELKLGCALGSGLAHPFGLRPNQRLSLKPFKSFDGAAEPRLTSVGEAAAKLSNHPEVDHLRIIAPFTIQLTTEQLLCESLVSTGLKTKPLKDLTLHHNPGKRS